LRDAVILDEQVIVVIWILRQKLIVHVIRIPPQHTAHGIAHGQTSGCKIGAGETDHTLEWYQSDGAVGHVYRAKLAMHTRPRPHAVKKLREPGGDNEVRIRAAALGFGLAFGLGTWEGRPEYSDRVYTRKLRGRQ
jgi:hypothetical protein